MSSPAVSPIPPTPIAWRAGLIACVVFIAGAAYLMHSTIGTRGQAGAGILCFLALAAAFSKNLRAVNWKTMAWGIGLQFLFAVLVIYAKPVREAFSIIGTGIKVLIESSDKGAEFVFGSLSKPSGPAGFVFAFKALPPIIFVSSFFSVLYYLGILQLLVRAFAAVMRYLMGTSGAETLSVAANVFMGQTEAPLIVKPFIPRMTQSELLALMGSGMAHISGGMMAVYISYGADPVAILCTCVMACPCSLYLTKLILPELETPETLGGAKIVVEKMHVNVIDAAASGVKDGLLLALNVAAMLIGFLAFIALLDAMIGGIKPLLLNIGLSADLLKNWPDDLKLQTIFGWVFSPAAFLLGVNPEETSKVGSLLGMKLAANEHVAYVSLTKSPEFAGLSKRSFDLSVYALSGFANFSSIGIQLGGIGAMAEGRKSDLAKLGMRALFVGFMTTLINAAVAGLLTPDR